MIIFRLSYLKYYAVSFWFLALFPGRIGYDNVQALNTIRSGQSTDWWTAQYFWLLKITSINGKAVYLTSFLSLIIGVYAISRFIQAFRLSRQTSELSLLVLCAFPLLPVFMLTISHDAFAAAGLVLLTSLLVSSSYQIRDFSIRKTSDFVLSILLLTTTFSGQVIAALALISFFVLYRNLNALILIASVVVVFFASSFGVAKTIPSEKFLWPMIADIKCVVQHPEADTQSDLWIFLQTLAPISEWKSPVSCNKMDYAAGIINDGALGQVNKFEFIGHYLKVAVSNPQIVIMSHLQKSRGVFPPPFFPPPKNMISWDSDKPVGQGTDSSLQTEAEVLHISIDAKEYRYTSSLLTVLEALALLPVFFINQASWFWGWSGLWFLFLVWSGAHFRVRNKHVHLVPVVTFMAILFLTSPYPSPRYSMGIILMGFTSLVLILLHQYSGREKVKQNLVE